MNAPRDSTASEARRWLQWGREDLTLAEHANADPEVVRRGVCAWAHQATEKALKALLVAEGTDPPRVHDLVRLARMVDPSLQRRLNALDLAELTRWAIEGRYPSDIEDASPDDARLALSTAKSVLLIAESIVEARGRPPR